MIHTHICFTSKSHMFPLRIFAAPQDGPRRDHRDVLPRWPLRRRRGGGRRCGGDVVQGGHQEPAMEEFDADKHMIFYGFSVFHAFSMDCFNVCFDVVSMMWFYICFYMRFSVHLGPFFLKISSVLLGSSGFLDGKFTSLMKYLERSARHGRWSGIAWKSAQMPTICQHGREATLQNAMFQ